MSKTGRLTGDNAFSRGSLYLMLRNRVYRGEITHKGQSYAGQHPAIIDQELWDQVQALTKGNIQGTRRRPRSTDTSLLLGLMYDSEGNRFTPSHAQKKGRRYRYYVSQALLKTGAKQTTLPCRIPAREVEELVTTQLRSLLQSPQRMTDLLGQQDADRWKR